MYTKRILIVSSTVIVFCALGYLVLMSKSPAQANINHNDGSYISSKDNENDDGKDNNGDTYFDDDDEYDDSNINFKDIENMFDLDSIKLDLDPSSIAVLTNKEHNLPRYYVPENMVIPDIEFDIVRYDDKKLMQPEAAKALEALFRSSQKKGLALRGISGYRSYDRQYEIFTYNLITKGKDHTVLYSAVPGTSEHQTGLAIDLSTASLNNRLIEDFVDTEEGKWIANNAHRFGFIVRYAKDKTHITGYAYEPWHIRYVGKDLAKYLYYMDLTLEEFYSYTPSSDFNFEIKYAEILSYRRTPPVQRPPVNVIEDDDIDDDKDDDISIKEPDIIDKPDKDKPDKDKPDIDKPDEDKPDKDKPDEDKPNEDKPDKDKPDIDKPDIDKPDIDKPDEDKPDKDKPDNGVDNPGENEKPKEEPPIVPPNSEASNNDKGKIRTTKANKE